jgi:hypothetical protein
MLRAMDEEMSPGTPALARECRSTWNIAPFLRQNRLQLDGVLAQSQVSGLQASVRSGHASFGGWHILRVVLLSNVGGAKIPGEN